MPHLMNYILRPQGMPADAIKVTDPADAAVAKIRADVDATVVAVDADIIPLS